MRRKKFYYFRDDFRAFIRGYNDYEEASRDGSKLFVEFRDLETMLYVGAQDTQHFFIDHADVNIANLLNNFFFQRQPHLDGRLYGNALSLSHMFSWLLKYSALYGDMFYYVDWSAERINNIDYILPTSFDYIHPETMCALPGGGYVQRYSLYERLRHQKDKLPIRKLYFESAEVFHTQFPLSSQPPALISMKLLKNLRQFMQFMLQEGESQVYSRPRKLGVELARSKSFQNEKRKNDLAKAKIRMNFHLPLAIEGVNLTRYYDFFTVARYKAEKCKARNYYVEKFNEQILRPLAEKNGWQDPPLLKVRDFLTEEEIWLHFRAWEKSEMNDDDFIEKVARAD